MNDDGNGVKSNKKTIRGHTRQHEATQGHNVPQKLILCSHWPWRTSFRLKWTFCVPFQISCSLAQFLFPCTIFVRFGTFFELDSTPARTTTTRTTKLFYDLWAELAVKKHYIIQAEIFHYFIQAEIYFSPACCLDIYFAQFGLKVF